MGAFKRIHPLPPAPFHPLCNEVAVRSMLFAVHACVNGPSSLFAVPSKKKGARRGPRAPMRQRCAARQLAVRRSAGALAAARQQSSGCAYSDVRWESTSTTFNIITIITTYISHGGCRNVYASGCLCVFLALHVPRPSASPTTNISTLSACSASMLIRPSTRSASWFFCPSAHSSSIRLIRRHVLHQLYRNRHFAPHLCC